MSDFRKTLLLLLILSTASASVYSQLAGRHSYDFLNLTSSARIAAYGGKIVSLPEGDLSLAFHNPALLSPEMDQTMLINYVNYFSDINYGYASYSRDYGELGSFAAGIQYINYGEFIQADEAGNITGEFSASEYSLNLIYSRSIDSLFRAGINFKPILSTLERYTSLGFAIDLGANYISRDGGFSAGLVIKNAGFQIKAYNKGNHESLPFEIRLGASQKLKHAPFRFIFTAQQLERFKLSPDDDNNIPGQGSIYDSEQTGSQIEEFGDNLLKHLLLGVEFSPADAFSLNFGYNYLRRQELQVASRISMVGFSWGFEMRLRKFSLSYGRASYHLAGASNHFSLAVNLKEY